MRKQSDINLFVYLIGTVHLDEHQYEIQHLNIYSNIADLHP